MALAPLPVRTRRAAVVVVASAALTGLSVLVPAATATAAEAGAARPTGSRAVLLSSAGASVGAHGSCLTWANGSGDYSLRCAGRHYASSFRDILQGAEVPTCWLVAPGSSDLTPSAPQLTFLASLGRASAPIPGAAEPTASPTATASPTPAPTASPTVTPTAAPPAPTPTASTPTAPLPTPAPTAPLPTPAPTAPLPAPAPTTPAPRPPQDFLKVCLTPTPDPSSAVPSWDTELVTSTVSTSPDDPDRLRFFWELTDGQQEYATWGEKRSGTIKTWGVVTSPSTTPRLGQVIAFSRNGPQPLTLAAGTTRMRARMLDLGVDTGEPGRPRVTCTGEGSPLAPGATQRTGPDICSFAYRQTSAGRDYQAPDNFQVTAHETWTVEVSTDAGATWVPFQQVEIERSTGLRVTEVQTLVVPLDTP